MKRYLLNIILFFSLVLIIDIAVGGIGDYLQAHAKGGNTRKLNDLVMNDYHDVIILGSSRAHHHYDTPFLSDTLGVDVYNAGYDGNGIVLAYGLLNMILERYKPKLVIYDVEPSFDISIYRGDNNHKRYISLLKPYYNKADVGRVIQDVSMEEWYKVHSGLVRYNSIIISLASDFFRNNKSDVSKHGYEPLIGRYDGEPRIGTGINDPVDSFKLKYFAYFISLTRSHDVPLIVVASPQFGNNLSGVLKPVADLCEEMNVPFLSYYEEEIFLRNKEWFKEPVHLNSEGAREFSRLFLSVINEMMN